MKRIWVAVLGMLLACAVGCGASDGELTVFAAASLEEPLTELGRLYTAEHPDTELLFHFDSSGTLQSQIQAGVDCDLFLSAGQGQMAALENLTDAPVALLENRVVLAVPAGNPAGIRSFAALKDALLRGTVLLAVGNADVPVGQYAGNILASLGLSLTEVEHCLTYGSNAKEVSVHVKEGAVDCGIVYETDALAVGLTVVDTAGPDLCGQVIYPAAVLKAGTNRLQAADFLEFLTGDRADEAFARAGFTPIA